MINQDTDQSFSWTVSLAGMQPLRAVFVGLCVALVGVCGTILAGAFVGVVGMAVLAAALSDFLFPVRFTINKEFAQVKTILGTRKVPWQQVVSCSYSDSAVLLSGVPSSSPLFAFRGVTLYFGPHRERVLELVRAFRGEKD